jgi:hypothetical protein
LGDILDLFHKIPHIFAFAHEILNYGGKQLLRALIIILKLLTRCLKSLRIFIKTEISQVHIVIFNIMCIRLLVIMGAKPSEALIT